MNKTVALGLVIIIITSCSFNATFTNEESVKNKGEQIADTFYNYVAGQRYDQRIQPYMSKRFLAQNTVAGLDSILIKIKNKMGQYQSRTLKDWSTKRKMGTNPLWHCHLLYVVKYKRGKAIETLNLVKENDSIKILSYSAREK